jgi:serine/threonine-protein kinase
VEPPPQPSSPTAEKSRIWRAGSIIGGRYRLRGQIGAGAMGEVWRAEHVTLGTTVAVKLVDTANREDGAETLARFHQEARAAATLRSPHVVQILDHGADDRVAFIAMEFLEGEGLEHRIERRGKLLPSEVAHILRETARGIDRAHAAGIVHRDLKPANVFLARVEGVEIVKVLDFGIAKFLGAPQSAQLKTQHGFVVGTPAYMSPEQVLGKAIDHRSDLWQMAIIAYEAMTGRRPFEGESLGQLFMAICSQAPPAPSSIATVPPAFDAWFARAAHKDPAQRFQSAGEMAEALGAILAPGGVGESAIPTIARASKSELLAAMASARNTGWSTARLDPPPRSPMPVALVAALVLAPLAIIVLGGVWWYSTRPPETAAITLSSAATAAAAPPPATASAAPPATASPPTSATASPATTATATAAPPPASKGKRGPSSSKPAKGGAGSAPVDLGI